MTFKKEDVPSANYDVKTKTITEWNIGCERCHVAGRLPVKDQKATTVVNPAAAWKECTIRA